MKKILLIRTGAIGDTLLLLPFVKSLEHQYPGVEIGLLGRPERMQLLHTQLQNSKIYDSEGVYSSLFSNPGSIKEDLKEFLKSRDWIIHFTSEPEGELAWVLSQSGCPRVNSLKALPDKDFSHHVVFHPFDALDIPVQEEALFKAPPVWNPLDHFSKVLIDKESKNPPPPLQDQIILTSDRNCKRGAKEDPYIILFPGAGSKEKRWPLAYWEIVIESVIQKTSFHILFVLGPAESNDKNLKSLTSFQNSRISVVENMDLLNLSNLLKACQGFIGNDSGITHLASLMNIPTLALFGPTHPFQWGPVGLHSEVLWGKDHYHYPEWLSHPMTSPEKKCMEEIDPEKVIDWVDEQISKAE